MTSVARIYLGCLMVAQLLLY